MNNSIEEKTNIKMIITQALVAAAYFVLTAFTIPLSFSFCGLRLSEVLCILPIFGPQYIIGISIGCFLSNTIMLGNIIDIVLGTVATIIGGIGTYKFRKKYCLAAFCPVVSNTIFVTLIYKYAYGINYALPLIALQVFISESITIVLFGKVFIKVSSKFFSKNTIFLFVGLIGFLLGSILIQRTSFAMNTSNENEIERRNPYLRSDVIVQSIDQKLRVASQSNVSDYSESVELNVSKNIEYVKKELYKYLNDAETEAIETNLKYYREKPNQLYYNNMREILISHCEEDTDIVLGYLINFPTTKVFARYTRDGNGKFVYVPIKCLTKENISTMNDDTFRHKMDFIYSIFPEEVLSKLSFVIFDSDGNNDNKIVYTYLLGEKGENFFFTVDVNSTRYTTRTVKSLINAYSRFIMIKGDQTREFYDERNNQENNIEIDGIIFKEGSYLNMFYKSFWLNEIAKRDAFEIAKKEQQEVSATKNSKDTNNSSITSKVSDEYTFNNNDFVNEQAAYSICDDFEESYFYFVTTKRPCSNFLKDDKILYFYKFPEFEKTRNFLNKSTKVYFE